LRIADALRRRGHPRDLPAIAHHLAASRGLVPTSEVRSAAVDAGAHALRSGDHAAAARNFDLALECGALDGGGLDGGPLDESVEERVELLLRAAAAHHVAGHRERGWERAHAAAELAGPERPVAFARAALAFAQDRRYTTDQAGAVALLHAALDSLDDDHALRREVLASCSLLEMSMPVPVELRELEQLPGYSDSDGDVTQATVAWNWVHRTDVARSMADEALRLARATGDDELVARVAMAWRQTHCAPEYLADRLDVTEHAMTHARSSADRVPAAVASVLDNLEAGRRPSVDRALAELVGLSDATGDPAVRWRTGQLAAMLALASGRPDVAERESAEAFAHGAQASENGRWVVRGVQATVLSLEVDDDPSETIAFLVANIDELVYPPMRAGAVYSLTRDGQHADAMRYLPDLVAQVVDDRGREASWLMTAALAADAVAAVGDVALAAAMLPVLLPFADRIAVDGLGFHCHGCLARPLAQLAAMGGEQERAQQLRDLALARDAAAGLRRWVLDGAVDALSARLASGALAPGGLGLGVAEIADEATSLGLLRTARRARALLHEGSGQLSARQRDVLLALAEGLTYQAASERLGFSHSTIRHEAMRVYAALGAGDRDDAVRIAREIGLVPASDSR
jgi:DNA-binding CsgD family transcriptional regulator